ncbi:PREDICTED: cytochrome P450 [Prunus dulcis]|uniref:PREDICTED: cytochrome P450 n=1 Tax=Prunus dulcis TaxID=3755 RepID=A0A5E4EYG0_PRUDU|nr:licodione synthase-like [Prunus dulcis]VVA20774.1 PREDICTED: cytochrome P450 [Prunus dulcis]
MALELVLLMILFLLLAIPLLLFPTLTSKIFQTHLHLPPSPLALPIIGHYHLLGPLIHRTFHNLSLSFGPLFSLRLGSLQCVVVSTPNLAKEFLSTHELSFISHAQSLAIESISYNASLAFAPYGSYWKFIKKLTVNELLGNRSINNLVSIRTQEYLRLLRFLAKKAESGEAVNLTEEFPKLWNNVTVQMIVGNRGLSAEGRAARAEEAGVVVRQATRLFGEVSLCDFFWVCKKLDLRGFVKRIEETHRRFDVLVEKVIREREELRKKERMEEHGGEKEEEVKDFLDTLLDLLEDGSAEVEFTRIHLKALITDLFTAGTDTNAISLEWALAELINHPRVLKKAREEIDRAIGNQRVAGESDVPNLPYIQAIIKETFRLHPPVPLVPRNSVQQCKIGGYDIPTNTMLYVNVWAIGRDPKNWESPLDFCPERFLQLSEDGGQMNAVDVRGQHFQLLPFGSGRRVCPGVNLTMKMLPAVLAALIQCFDWKVDGSDCKKMNGDDVLEMDERPGLTAPRAHDLVCVPVARFSPLNILDP